MFGSIHYYFGMMNCIAQCIHQRYLDNPKTHSIEFSNSSKWPATIPDEVKKLCDDLRNSVGWNDFKNQYRNAITHRQLPVFWNACTKDKEFGELFVWAKMNDEGRVVLESNKQLKMAHETDFSSPTVETKYLDDRIRTHMDDAFVLIQHLCKSIYELPYLSIEVVKD